MPSPARPPLEPALAPKSPAPPARAKRTWWIWLVVIAVLLPIGYAVFVRPFLHPSGPMAGGRGGGGGRRGGFSGAGLGPVPVTAEPARKADLDVRIVALGTVTPVRTVTIRSRVDGELQKIYFEEGKTVEAGAPLADLDPRPFEVQKNQAEAQLAKDHALLEEARLDLTRYQALLEQDSVAKQQVDSQAALVRQYEASIQLDEASVKSAALQLTYAHIVSPISGRIGLRLVDQGNIVHAGDATGLAVITQLQPITVLFSIPQNYLPQVMQSFATGEPMVVEAYAQDGHTQLATGRLVTVDNQIDPTTGTVKLRAEFANPDESLFPNQFVNVQLVSARLTGATVVTTAAVQRGTVGTYVYVVSDAKTVSVRPVETGASEHGVIAITKGLHPGEMVVVDGVDKLREGAAVELTEPAGAAPAAGAGAGPHAGKHWADGSRRPADKPSAPAPQ